MKKGISLEFTVALIVASVLLVIGGVAVAKTLGGLDSTAYDSYLDFTKKATAIASADSGTADGTVVTLPKDGALIGFNKEPYLRVKYQPATKTSSAGTFGTVDLDWSDHYIVWKPDVCGDADSCICSCSKIELVEDKLEFRCAPDAKLDCTKGNAFFAKSYNECNDVVTTACDCDLERRIHNG